MTTDTQPTTAVTADEARGRLDRNLTNHPPVNDATILAMEAIRAAAKALGHRILDHCPTPSRERSLALTNLEQTVMWAIADIARNQPPARTTDPTG